MQHVQLVGFYIAVDGWVKRKTIWNISAQLIAPGQDSLVYQYKTEVTLAVANGQYDVKTEITAKVHITSLGDCNYTLQVNNISMAWFHWIIDP